MIDKTKIQDLGKITSQADLNKALEDVESTMSPAEWFHMFGSYPIDSNSQEV